MSVLADTIGALLPFNRTLKLGMAGKDVRAVKRALRAAGYSKGLNLSLPILGLNAVGQIKRFQADHDLTVTGRYDAATHVKLSRFMDAYAQSLYRQSLNDGKILQLPATFFPTHETAGLPGFPAIDVFADANTKVGAPADGTVDKLSGHDPKHGGVPGGAYGWSVYLSTKNGRYFLTHMGERFVLLGDKVRRGEIIGTVCDSRVSGNPGTSHIHEGLHRT